jgi:DNA transformation protein
MTRTKKTKKAASATTRATKRVAKKARVVKGAVKRTSGVKKTSGAFAHLKVSPTFRDYVLAQLDELGDVTPRSMFGAVGLYHRGLFFGIVAGSTLYLKVGEANRRDFERSHAEPFRPYPNRPSTSYFAVPVEILESAQELTAWARKSLRVASH